MTDTTSTRARRLASTGLAALLFAVALVDPSPVRSAGFEVGENTTLSTARGGTGVASKRDPSAMYFNPALLSRTRGFQGLTDANAIDFNLSFDRADLVYRRGRQTERKSFDETVRNEMPVTPVPAAAFSWDFGLDNLGAAIGVFAPHAVGERCFGSLQGGDCSTPRTGPARHMLVHSEIIQFYAMAGVGYEFELRNGSLRVGASGIYARQNADFTLVVNSQITAPRPPFEEDPEQEATFEAANLTDWNLSGVFGASYGTDHFEFGASYRPPIRWESNGTASIDFPKTLREQGLQLTDDGVTFKTWQAGSLRFGWRYRQGEHPGRPERPEFDLEVNGVWEDWSRVENFRLNPDGDIVSSKNSNIKLPLRPFLQRKNWRDSFSLRLGGSWGALEWLTLHGGGFLETPAQPNAYTNLDFASWERYAGSLGASFHPTKWLDLKIAFMHVASPDRRVESGEVYNQIPTSDCRGPDYQSDKCSTPGQPPGNPQNEGNWSAHYNIGSVGATVRFN